MASDRERLFELLEGHPTLGRILEASTEVGPKHWSVAAGFIQQAVWNVLHGRPHMESIKDIDWVYFDPDDLSEEGEDRVIKKVKTALSFCPLEIDVKNQARVHLWYPKKFGREMAPYKDLSDALASWPTTSTGVGLTLVDGRTEVVAPHGLADLINMHIRPVTRLAGRDVYESKVTRWKKNWPKITVEPWPEG